MNGFDQLRRDHEEMIQSPFYKRLLEMEKEEEKAKEMEKEKEEENEKEKETINSTTNRIDDVAEQSEYIALKHAAETSGHVQQYEGLMSIQTELCKKGSSALVEQHFPELLITVFEVLSKGRSDVNKKLALRVLATMCTLQASLLFDTTEMAICKVLDAAVNSKNLTMNVTADDCLRTLATHLPLAKVVNISKVILNEERVQEARASLVLKMMTSLFEGLQADKLRPVIDDLAPCAIKAYDSSSPIVRKTAMYCLVAMVNKLGMNSMEPHLQRLSSTKLNHVQVYVNRSMEKIEEEKAKKEKNLRGNRHASSS